MKLRITHKTLRSGFSLLEIIIAIAIIAILVGVVGYRSGSAIQRGQASRLLQLVKSCEKAAATHYADTGRYPREYMVNQAASRRHLTSTQAFTGWQGPYLERPFANQDTNPFGAARVYNNLQQSNWIPGFDLDGDGTADLTGNGCMLYFTGVPQEVVQALDSALDGGIPGDWFTTGRVVWQQGSNRTLIYVFK
tara:strand:+ start:3984 stop:4562 length:579 start_codon:yes stop_codon:yes gene_type:complete